MARSPAPCTPGDPRTRSQVEAGRLDPPAYSPTGQCSTSSIGKSFGFPVHSRAPCPAAAAAMRQSACHRVMPREANSRRHVPAARATGSSTGSTTNPAIESVQGSVLRRPESSDDLLDVDRGRRRHVAHPSETRYPLDRWAATKEVDQHRRVENSEQGQPARRVSPWRWSGPTRRCRRPTRVSSRPARPRPRPRARQRRSCSSARSMARRTNALRPRGPVTASSSLTSASSSSMCIRMCQAWHTRRPASAGRASGIQPPAPAALRSGPGNPRLDAHQPRSRHAGRCGALGAEGRVVAVAGVEPRLVGQRAEDLGSRRRRSATVKWPRRRGCCPPRPGRGSRR